METILEWNLAQISDQERVARAAVSGLLDEVRGGGKGSSGAPPAWASKAVERTVPLDDVIVFNRSHLRVFASDPAYRDIFTYINSFGPDWISVGEIAAALNLAEDRAGRMLEELTHLGVIVAQVGKEGWFRASKRNFYFPDDEDFFALRNLNVEHNAQSIMKRLKHRDLLDKKAYRGLVTRELTDEQVGLLLEGIDQLMSHVVAMPETSRPRTIYSLCVLLGERFARLS